MTVIVLAMLAVALACIVVGIITAAAPWFVASLVASVAAGILLWYQHTQSATHSASPDPTAAGSADSAAIDGQVWVVDGWPDYHAHGCALISGQVAEQVPLSQAQDDGFIACSRCAEAAAIT